MDKATLKNTCFLNEVAVMAGVDQNVKNIRSGQDQVVLRGTVIFRQSDVGSKNEHLKPFLLGKDKSIVSLYKKDDNPFENASLKKFKGIFVQVVGRFYNSVLEISDIKEIVDDGNGI